MTAMKRVGEIMIPVDKYPSVRDKATLRDAIAVIEGAELEVDRRKSLPRVILVFDEIDVLVGYIRRRDIMQGLEPKFLTLQPLEYRKKLFDVAIDPNLLELSFDRVVKGIREQADRPVSDVMNPIEITIDADDHMIKATLVPVVQEGRVVGVLRSVDLFHELVKLVH
jgi:hypothetical protein